MLGEILREIDEMGYSSVGIGCGLEDAGITDRYEAAAYGFQAAKDRIAEIIRSHSNDGWIYCGDGWIVEGYPEWESPDVVAWHPLPETYRLQKSVGEDYRQHVMERFLKTE